jgi:hypothetical protein
MLQDDMAHARYVTLLGTLSDDDTSDTYELHGMTDFALIGKLLAAGREGDSSTASTIDVRVIADDDGHLLASCGLAIRETSIRPWTTRATASRSTPEITRAAMVSTP